MKKHIIMIGLIVLSCMMAAGCEVYMGVGAPTKHEDIVETTAPAHARAGDVDNRTS